MRVYVLHPYTNLKFLGLTVRRYGTCVCVSRPVTMTFDLLTLKLVRNVARVIGYHPADFGDTATVRYRFVGH